MEEFGAGRFSPMDKDDDVERLKVAGAKINLERGEKARENLQKAIDAAFSDENMSPKEIQAEVMDILENLKRRRNIVD